MVLFSQSNTNLAKGSVLVKVKSSSFSESTGLTPKKVETVLGSKSSLLGGVVLSTLREAFDKDYQLTVLADGCVDSDGEVHQVLTNKIFPKQAEVMTIDDWRKAL